MYTIFLPIIFLFFKLEGMFRPPKIPSNHPSFVEVEEDENVVEKFKEGMMSVRNILALDRLKQEVCLKEKLAKSGQLLHPSHNAGTIDEEETKVLSMLFNDALCFILTFRILTNQKMPLLLLLPKRNSLIWTIVLILTLE